MALDTLQAFYDSHELAGLEKQAFAEALLQALDIKLEGEERLKGQVPESGSLILVSNHPLGCIEGVAIASVLNRLRPDVKVLANRALSIFTELQEQFIFIDPLRPKDIKNGAAIKQCRRHLMAGGLLLIFPAGKVSDYQADKGRVCDDIWHRLPAQLARSLDCPVLPLFVEGRISRWFTRLGRIHPKLKILLLFRELLKCRGMTLEIKTGRVLPASLLSKLKSETAITVYLRLQSYLLQKAYRYDWPEDKSVTYLPLLEPMAPDFLLQEIQSLPEKQHLLDYKQFSVFYGYQSQLPKVVTEIARLREAVFREFNEGSGEPLDTDGFDASYTHLFIFDRDNRKIIGAYRMGQTDKLLAENGLDGLYLSRMFNFKPGFINQTAPCLEMGRSFIVPEHRRSFYGLFLLWRGIGEFVVRHPRYRTLYGTVSISKLYQAHSVDCIHALSLTPSIDVAPKVPFAIKRHPELTDFLSQQAKTPNILSILVQGIEEDGKDIPILMKQYQKLGARFYCIGIDNNFNHTPGLLLSVNLPEAPVKALKQYLAEGLDDYLAYDGKDVTA